MTEQKILEKKKRELEKMVSARQEKENALRDKIQRAEGQRASAEANMQTAAEADNMMEYKKAKDDRDSAQDLIEFCNGRLNALDHPYDAGVCKEAVEAVKKEYDAIYKSGMQDLKGLLGKVWDLCGDMISACDAKRAFCEWVEKGLLRIDNSGVFVATELPEIRQLQGAVMKRLEGIALVERHRDGGR
jgi:hypothetical protein